MDRNLLTPINNDCTVNTFNLLTLFLAGARRVNKSSQPGSQLTSFCFLMLPVVATTTTSTNTELLVLLVGVIVIVLCYVAENFLPPL